MLWPRSQMTIVEFHNCDHFLYHGKIIFIFNINFFIKNKTNIDWSKMMTVVRCEIRLLNSWILGRYCWGFSLNLSLTFKKLKFTKVLNFNSFNFKFNFFFNFKLNNDVLAWMKLEKWSFIRLLFGLFHFQLLLDSFWASKSGKGTTRNGERHGNKELLYNSNLGVLLFYISYEDDFRVYEFVSQNSKYQYI